MLIFDIETGGLPDEILRKFAPEFTEPPHPGEFNPSAVKLGNLKDQTKINDKMESARAAHAEAVQSHSANVEAARAEHWQKVVEGAALSPITGQVLAIGLRSAKGISILEGDESDLIIAFWSQYEKMRQQNRQLIGCNIFGFDLPFLIRRSWILRIDIPSTVRDGRYWNRLFVDLRDVWLCGQQWAQTPSSLDIMARALEVGEKPADIGGGDFARLYRGTPEEKAAALEYLRNDLDMTAKVAERLAVA